MKTFLRLVCSIIIGVILALLEYVINVFTPFGIWLPYWALCLSVLSTIIIVPICLFNDDGFKKLFQ